jgi:hypothetical protein
MDAEPDDVPASAAGVDNVEPPNSVHDVLITCGITNLAHRMTFLNIEGLDSIAAFASMSGDSDVTEMAKRMALRPNVAARRVILGTMHIK